MENRNDIAVFTPIIKVEQCANNIYMKRDDLIPFFLGGNKVRIAEEYFYDLQTKECNCIIGYGTSQSNLCRIIANMAISKGIHCVIVFRQEDDGSIKDTTNKRIVECCGAKTIYCAKSNVAEGIEKAFQYCKDKGWKAYYINGDKFGHGNEAIPVLAYVKVYKEILIQSSLMNVKFDYIFLPCGTGMTQSGLIEGKRINNGSEKIIGISVGRKCDVAINVITDYLYAFEGRTSDCRDIIVEDKYTGDGYGLSNAQIYSVINNKTQINGIPLDPIYTGKAYWGMEQYLKTNGIKGKNVLFIHTGGIPLYFDMIKTWNQDYLEFGGSVKKFP